MVSEPSPSAGVRYPGLTEAAVLASRREHGTNRLSPPKRTPWWRLFLEKFDDPVIRILMIAAAIAIGVGALNGHYLEGVGILVAILLATVLAFLNEHRAQREFDILNRASDDEPVRTIRAGAFTQVPKSDLVRGDIVLVEAGDELPADGEVLEAVSLEVNESRLTGEPVPVDKRPSGPPRPDDAEATYPPHRVLRGTTVADGYGTIRLTAVGDATEIGRTMEESTRETELETPLNRQLGRLSQVIGVVGLAVATATFWALVVQGGLTGRLTLEAGQWLVFGILASGVVLAMARVWLPIAWDCFELLGLGRRPEWVARSTLVRWLQVVLVAAGLTTAGLAIAWANGWIPEDPNQWLPRKEATTLLAYFMIAVTIIVVAVPEGLAMSVTLSLAYSMRRMAAAQVLVRRLHACETIGAATTICSDKTGTLTRNAMRVRDAVFPLLGDATLDEAPASTRQLLAEAISINTTAHLAEPHAAAERVLGNPTEGALLLWLEAAGVGYLEPRSAATILDQAPFNTERKFMATLARDADGQGWLHVKGAPEIVLAASEHVATSDGPQRLGDARREEIENALRQRQRRGMRTLALAYRRLDGDEPDTAAENLAQRLVWLGFVGIEDPLRPEVPAAIEQCRRAGVHVKIVTGDNRDTALEIAKQIGMWAPDDRLEQYIQGPEFAALDESEAQRVAADLKVLSRARPSDKLRLVRLLQQQGQIVAVTGDGTNDAPALNHADVGLAMGRTGTSVAKEASDIILLDDSFPSIVNSILWGRSLYENIQRFLLFQLTINVAALLIAFSGPFIGVQLPLTVIQMLWINLIMDTFAALALATEPPNPAVLERPPRGPRDFIVTPSMAVGIFGTGLAFVGVLLGVLVYFQNNSVTAMSPGGLIERVTPWELTVFFALFVFMQFWNLFNARALGRNRSALAGLGENPSFVLIAIGIFGGTILAVQFGGQEVFRTVPLDLTTWGAILGASSLVLWIGEAIRWASRRPKNLAGGIRAGASSELASVP